MESMNINDFIQRLFARAAEEGYEAAEACYNTGDEFTVAVKGGSIVDYSVASSCGLSFRALIDGKMGRATTQVFDEDAVELLIESVLNNAHMIESEDEQFIFEGSKSYPELNVYNPAIAEVTAAEKIKMAKALEQKVLALDPAIKQVQMTQVVSEASEQRIVNSKGLDVSFRDNVIGCGAAAVAMEDGKVAVNMDFKFSRNPADIDLEKIAERAAKDAVAGLHAQPVASGSYTVMLRNNVTAALLGCFSSVFSAEMAQKGLSLFKGREGEQVAADIVTIVDDPLSVRGLASRPFDSEGVACARHEIVKNGKLTTLMHNLKTAKKQGVQSTGNAAGKGVAPSNFYIEAGESSFDELCEKVGNGVLITKLEGLHSGANQISGDFSLSARGYRIEGGKVKEAVNQITVAGNYFALLKNIICVGSDLEFGFPGTSCIGAPSVIAEGLTIAGK